MNKIYAPAVALAIASILFSACSKTEGNGVDDASQIHHITLNAGTAENDSDNISNGNSDKVNGIETKAIFAADVTSNTPFYWQKTDKVGVFASGSEGIYPLEFKERTNDYKSATFEGDIKGTLGEYAVYPYNENHKISGNTLTYHLPSEYNDLNSSLAQEYLSSTSLSNIDSYAGNAHPALLAKISTDGTSTEFKHLGGVLCISLDGYKSNASLELTITADRQICGDFSVDLSANNPQIETTSKATANTEEAGNNNTVKIYGRILDYNKPSIFYIPMPVGNYNLRIALGYPTGDVIYYTKVYYRVSAEKSLSINRTNIKRASLSANTLHKNGYMLVDGYKFVDLGLPSGKLWAEINMGASLPGDYGNFYNWEDACKAVNGKKCRIPTIDEFNELISNTEHSATTQTNSAGETKNGWLFTSKNNGKSIFFPFTGYYDDESAYRHGNETGVFWSSTEYTNNGNTYVHTLSINADSSKPSVDGGLGKTWGKGTVRAIVTP